MTGILILGLIIGLRGFIFESELVVLFAVSDRPEHCYCFGGRLQEALVALLAGHQWHQRRAAAAVSPLLQIEPCRTASRHVPARCRPCGCSGGPRRRGLPESRYGTGVCAAAGRTRPSALLVPDGRSSQASTCAEGRPDSRISPCRLYGFTWPSGHEQGAQPPSGWGWPPDAR